MWPDCEPKAQVILDTGEWAWEALEMGEVYVAWEACVLAVDNYTVLQSNHCLHSR